MSFQVGETSDLGSLAVQNGRTEVEDLPGSASGSKSLTVFNRGDERLNHFSIDVIAVELIRLRQPEIAAGVVAVFRIVGLRHR